MPDFTMVVVGAGGGPTENDLSSYYVKPSGSRWDDGIVGLEAGSGLGALTQIINQNPHIFDDDDDASSNSNTEAEYAPAVAFEVYSWIRSFIITHGHLDHVMSLVMAAGSAGGPSKRILGLPSTIEVLETLFDGRVWPKLAARQNELAPPFFYRYRPVSPREQYVRVTEKLSARVFPISHGACQQDVAGSYESSAWFIRNDETDREFLFFGDVEPDSISYHPRTRTVWRNAATKIAEGKLDTIFLECSYRSNRPLEELYGHLSPPYVMDELRTLASEVVAARTTPKVPPARLSFFWDWLGYGPGSIPLLPDAKLVQSLKGLRLIVIHCKSTPERYPNDLTIADVITSEIQALVDHVDLGVAVEAAKQGMKIDI